MHQKAPTDPVLMNDFLLAWQMPARIFCDWWTVALESFQYSCGPLRPAGSEKDEGQLIVPDVIEEEGDHALFA